MQKASAKKIIDRIYRDFKPADSDWVGDAWDMIGEAIEGIGYHLNFVDHHEEVKVENNRVDIPGKFTSVNYVEYEGYRLLLGLDKSMSNIASKAEDTVELDPYRLDELNSLTIRWETLEELKYKEGTTPEEIIELQKKQDELMEKIIKLTRELRVNSPKPNIRGHYYQITEDEKIITSFSTGNITIYGKSYPVDKDGIPYIIDTYKYREACFFKVASLLIMQGYKHGVLDYQLADNKWEYFRAQAGNEPKLKNVAKLDRFASMWTRYKFNPHLSSNFFKTAEQK